jgi:hypothetical protein
MRRSIAYLTTTFLCLGSIALHAQFGPGGGGQSSGPSFGGDMAKLFGDNQDFSANIEIQFKLPGNEQEMTMPAKVAYSEGKSRFEMDMTQVKSAAMPPNAAAQMKQLGLDKMITVSLPAEKASYLIYPNLDAYVELPLKDPDALNSASDYKIEMTEVGKETLDGHDCVKNKVVVTGKDGKTHESTVWNATDLKKFPVKIETTENGHPIVMLFKDVKLAKPASDGFQAPTDYTKYDDMRSMMQQVIMKRLGGGGAGTPPAK